MAQAEEVVIDAVLLSRLILLHRAEMLERTDADNAIKRSKGIDCDLFPVLDIDFFDLLLICYERPLSPGFLAAAVITPKGERSYTLAGKQAACL